MPTNLLVLPLLGGYLFVHLCYYLRFRAQRLEGYRLVIESAVAGAVLTAISRALIYWAETGAPAPLWLLAFRFRTFWESFWPLPDSGTATGAFLLGISLPAVANYFFGKSKAKERALRKHGNDLFRLLHNAATSKTAVAVTMQNRKWYAGMVADSPSLDPQETYFRLLAVLSGYRTNESLEVEITVHYRFPEQLKLRTGDIVLALPLAAVQSANYFDEDLFFEVFNRQSRADKGGAEITTVEPPQQADDIPETHYS